MMTEDKPRRGRPPSKEVADRDRMIHDLLAEHGPRTRNALCALTDLPPSLVWLSLDRLRRRGLVRPCLAKSSGRGMTTWSADADNPCP